MPRRGSLSISGKLDTLLLAEREVRAEVERLRREEGRLLLKVAQARDQLQYYERTLRLLRRDWGARPALDDVVRRLG